MRAPQQASAAHPALLQAAAAAGLGEDLRVDHDADVAALYRTLLATAPEAAGLVLAEEGDGLVARAQIQTTAGENRAPDLRDGIDAAFAAVEDAGAATTATSDAIISDVITTEVQDAQMQSLAITLTAAMALLVATFWGYRRRPFLGALTVLPAWSCCGPSA